MHDALQHQNYKLNTLEFSFNLSFSKTKELCVDGRIGEDSIETVTMSWYGNLYPSITINNTISLYGNLLINHRNKLTQQHVNKITVEKQLQSQTPYDQAVMKTDLTSPPPPPSLQSLHWSRRLKNTLARYKIKKSPYCTRDRFEHRLHVESSVLLGLYLSIAELFDRNDCEILK